MHLPRCRRLALALAVLVTGATACPAPGDAQPDPRVDVGNFVRSSLSFNEAPGVADADVRDLGARQLALAVDLLEPEAGQNQALSPTSIAMAFAMLSAGARGETLSELEVALHLPPQTDLHGRMNALLVALRDRDIAATDDSDGLALAPVNDLYPQQGFAIEAPFLDILGERYDAGVWLMDYVGQAEAARAAINTAIDDATNGRIPELLPAGSVDAATRLILTNALYLKGAWEAPFEPAATRDETFRAPGGDVQVPFLHGVHDGAKYLSTREIELVELPLVGGQIAVAFVPLSSVAGALDARVLTEAFETLDASPATPVDIALPKYTVRVATDLVPPLQALGVDDLFGAADLSGLSSTADLTVTGAFHETFFALDEKGVEAAAATAIVVGETSIPPPPVTVVLDEPFLFVLRDRATNTPLFVGTLQAP